MKGVTRYQHFSGVVYFSCYFIIISTELFCLKLFFKLYLKIDCRGIKSFRKSNRIQECLPLYQIEIFFYISLKFIISSFVFFPLQLKALPLNRKQKNWVKKLTLWRKRQKRKKNKEINKSSTERNMKRVRQISTFRWVMVGAENVWAFTGIRSVRLH